MKKKYRINKREDKVELKSLKSDLKVQKKKYSILKKKHSHLFKEGKVVELSKLDRVEEDIRKSKLKKSNSKKEYKVKKKVYKKKYPNKLKKSAKYTVSQIKSHSSEAILNNDEDLSRYVRAKQEYRAKKYGIEKSLKTGKKVVLKSSKILYGGANRSYNKMRGRGFTKTPTQFSLPHKAKMKILNNRRIQQIKKTRNKTKPFTRPFEALTKNVFKNPFKSTGLLSLLIIIFIVSLFVSTVSPARMKEWDMNDTWLYFTKLDREKSTEKVIYYSDIEEYIYFLNYRYDKSLKDIYGRSYSAYKNKTLPEQWQGRNYLNGMWDFLNKDENNLKTVDDLMRQKGKYHLEDKEIKEYRELATVASQIGRFPYAQELDNFLYEKKDKNYKLPLKIVERYGYKDTKTILDTTTFYAKANQYIYAPMTGSVRVDGSNIVIEQGNKKITFYNIQNIRLKSGSQAIRNEIIGQVKPEGNQVVKYEKIREKNKKKEWNSVNIGFYLPKVEYIEKTEVIRPLELEGDKLTRVNKFIEIIKKLIPEATNEGIAAALGNFDIESGVNPKRAEGDYLPAPIGVVDESSWDNPAWLDIGGVQIYNGRYPNILRRGLGLGQWTDTADGSVRHTLLRDFAKSKEKKWYDLELQIDFMLNGDNPYYRQHFRDIITSNNDVSVLTKKFLNNWEGNPSDKIDSRIERAKAFLGHLTRATSGQPLEEMENVTITSDFGVGRQIGSYTDVHNGIDLVYKDGRMDAPIYAVGDGEIIWAKADNYGGNGVIIKHDGYYSYYWHLWIIEVNEGSRIKSGTRLGIMGTTGLSTGVHLHFGLSKEEWRNFYDPKPFLKFNK